MGNKGFLKRVLPFLATFAVSVFILSVVFGMRPGPFRGHRHKGKMWQENQRLKVEVEDLKNENLRLRNGRNVCERHVDPATGDETFSVHPLHDGGIPASPNGHLTEREMKELLDAQPKPVLPKHK